jgi:hypothetical protein
MDLTELMNDLTDEERAKIAEVMERDVRMQQEEEQRLVFVQSVTQLCLHCSLQKLAETAIAEDLRDKHRSKRPGRQKGGLASTKVGQLVGLRTCKCCGKKLGYVQVEILY